MLIRVYRQSEKWHIGCCFNSYITRHELWQAFSGNSNYNTNSISNQRTWRHPITTNPLDSDDSDISKVTNSLRLRSKAINYQHTTNHAPFAEEMQSEDLYPEQAAGHSLFSVLAVPSGRRISFAGEIRSISLRESVAHSN